MGQVLDRLQGKEWKQRQIRKITDLVFERIKNRPNTAHLTFEDLYIAVLLVYNDLNKHLPGPHFDPPSKYKVKEMIQKCDVNVDGEIDCEEFHSFMKLMIGDTLTAISEGLLVTLVIAPAVAIVTKKPAEAVPAVGKLVQKLPNPLYASFFTLATLSFQNLGHRSKLSFL